MNNACVKDVWVNADRQVYDDPTQGNPLRKAQIQHVSHEGSVLIVTTDEHPRPVMVRSFYSPTCCDWIDVSRTLEPDFLFWQVARS